MDKIIQQIIEIEGMAQEIISPVKEKEADLARIIKQDTEEKKAEILKKIDGIKDDRIKENDEQTAKKILKIKEDAARKISGLDAKYKENKEVWENDLLKKIISL